MMELITMAMAVSISKTDSATTAVKTSTIMLKAQTQNVLTVLIMQIPKILSQMYKISVATLMGTITHVE